MEELEVALELEMLVREVELTLVVEIVLESVLEVEPVLALVLESVLEVEPVLALVLESVLELLLALYNNS